jgi:hypothetical protein
LLLGLLFLQFFLPRLYAARCAEYFRAAYAPRGQVEVKVRAFPFFKLGSGRLDNLTLAATQVEAGGIILDTVTAELNDVRGAGSLGPWQSGTWQSVGTARIVAEVSEAALNAYLTASLTDAMDVELRLHPDEVTLAGRIRFVGRLFTFFAVGDLVPAANNTIAFRVASIALEGVELPQLFTESAQTLFDGFAFPLGQTGLLEQMTVSAVNLREGYAEIAMTIEG